MNSSELQIWNNAAFDSGEFENTKKTSFFLDQSDPSSSKENRIPISIKTPAKAKPLQPMGNSFLIQNSEEIRDEKKIDSEMEEIKKEIARLTSRLEALRLEKAEQRIKTLDKLGRMVPAKFKEQKQTVNVRPTRGFSLGPSEIGVGFRRGVSMGPAEIYSASKSKQLGKQETAFTPVNRRKSCFLKLDDVEEERTLMGSNFTVDSKPRRTVTKTPVQRQAATTVGFKKEASRTVGMSSSSSSIQPKKLFSKEVDKSLPNTKIMAGRIVASRYNQSGSVSKSAIRKRSLDEETMKKSQEKGMRKKRWEIPSEIVIQGNVCVNDEISPRGIVLPKRIRTVRRSESETPRDSGPAKRVVDLVGRRSFFYDGEDDDDDVHKTLNFAEEEEEDDDK